MDWLCGDGALLRIVHVKSKLTRGDSCIAMRRERRKKKKKHGQHDTRNDKDPPFFGRVDVCITC